MVALLIWLAFCFCMAYGQGRLLPTLRTVPATSPDAKRNNAGLHGWLLAAYMLPVGLAWQTWPAMVAARVLVFDPAINLGSGRPLFEVGRTAFTDRLLRRLAPEKPERLRFLLWLAAVLAAAGFYFMRL